MAGTANDGYNGDNVNATAEIGRASCRERVAYKRIFSLKKGSCLNSVFEKMVVA